MASSTRALRVDRATGAAGVPGVPSVTALGGDRGATLAPEVSTGFKARIAERTRGIRRRRYVRLGIAVGSALAVGFLVWGVFFSPLFQLDLEEVDLVGQGTVIDPADVDAIVSEFEGTPLTRLDTVGLRTQILDVPGVRDARIARAWPTGLAISLVSREPVAAVPDGAGFALLDDEGIQVGRSAKAPKGLPSIMVPLDGDNRRTLEATLFMINAVPPEVRADIKSVRATSPDTASMKLRDGATVVWGSTADADLKVRVLEVLRAAKETKDSKVFDVSAPNAPITR